MTTESTLVVLRSCGGFAGCYSWGFEHPTARPGRQRVVTGRDISFEDQRPSQIVVQGLPFVAEGNQVSKHKQQRRNRLQKISGRRAPERDAIAVKSGDLEAHQSLSQRSL